MILRIGFTTLTLSITAMNTAQQSNVVSLPTNSSSEVTIVKRWFKKTVLLLAKKTLIVVLIMGFGAYIESKQHWFAKLSHVVVASKGGK